MINYTYHTILWQYQSDAYLYKQAVASEGVLIQGKDKRKNEVWLGRRALLGDGATKQATGSLRTFPYHFSQ